MQGLKVDTLASKRIPVASKISSLPRLVAEYTTRAARAAKDGPAAVASAPSATAVTQISAASSVSLEQLRTYSGSMRVSGSLSATSGQSGTWAGTLKDVMYLDVDRSGTGGGYESFSGNVTLSVTNPDGSHKSETSLLSFDTPFFTLQDGKFSFSQSSGFDFSGLFLTIKLGGSFGKTQATILSHLSLPFNGFVNDVAVSGSISGSGSETDNTRLLISGTAARQAASAAVKMAPFKTLAITDLDNSTVTATVTLSDAANGTLTNLSGGTYNRTTGIYRVTGGQVAINRAIESLDFVPAGNLGGPGYPVRTGFTLKVTDSDGASLANSTTSVLATDPVYLRGVSAHLSTTRTKTIAPFRYVTVGDLKVGEVDFVKVTLSNPSNGTLENLGGGYYSKKTGIYVIEATAAAATNALRGLKFDPAISSGSATTTGFTIVVRNAAGASVTTSKTTVTASSAPATTVSDGVALFSQYVASGLHRMLDHAAGIAALHDLPLSSHFELAGSHR
jgi:hypothetical protein